MVTGLITRGDAIDVAFDLDASRFVRGLDAEVAALGGSAGVRSALHPGQRIGAAGGEGVHTVDARAGTETRVKFVSKAIEPHGIAQDQHAQALAPALMQDLRTHFLGDGGRVR